VVSDKTDRSGYEELLTEDQLLARIDTAVEWSRRAGKLSATSEQEKATSEQVATWEQLVEYSNHVERLSDMVLRVKLADRLASLTAEQRENLLGEWGSAELGSYEKRKLWKYQGVISKGQALVIIGETRPKLKAKHAVYCTAARAFEIAEEDEFWPGRVNTPTQNSGKKRSTTPLAKLNDFHNLIASILIKSSFRIKNQDVADQITANNPSLPADYRDTHCPEDKPYLLSAFLNKKPILKKRFENRVSAVRKKIEPTAI
jgi:hypothetical protein